MSQVANPVSGQNFPPPETPPSQRFQGIANISIPSQLWVEHIIVHEESHSFQARYWWAMNYEDDRAADLISETNFTDDCAWWIALPSFALPSLASLGRLFCQSCLECDDLQLWEGKRPLKLYQCPAHLACLNRIPAWSHVWRAYKCTELDMFFSMKEQS